MYQISDDFRMSVGLGDIQGRLAVVVTRIDVDLGAPTDQEGFKGTFAAPGSCPPERRPGRTSAPVIHVRDPAGAHGEFPQ